MRKKKRIIIIILSLCIFVFLVSFKFVSSRSGFVPKNIFSRDQIVYRTKEGDLLYGLHTIGRQTYYFDKETGIMQIGFIDIDDNTYYFKEDGIMVKGLYRIEDDFYYLWREWSSFSKSAIRIFLLASRTSR